MDEVAMLNAGCCPDRERSLWMYRTMCRIRQFEEKVYYLFLQGGMPGTLHLYTGQEAVAAGVCAHLRPDDFITSTHRPHGHAIAKGVSINALMAELFAKSSGCCKGKGGSMHVGDIRLGAVPSIAIVGAGIPIATGVAQALRMMGTDRVAVCFFGDGAANKGEFHESLNMASIWDLPVIYVCENNLYAASTAINSVMKLENIADRAGAYGMPGTVVDGNDAIAVFGTVSEAIARARRGAGPTLVECKTYRRGGHSRSDPGKYRPQEEVREWMAKDPIPRAEAWLLDHGFANKEELAQVGSEVTSEIEAAVTFARGSADPDPQAALDDVYWEEAQE